MKIDSFSDFHAEHWSKKQNTAFWENLGNHRETALKSSDYAKIAILAGDIHQIGRLEREATEFINYFSTFYDKILYISGNHEYYNTNFYDVDSLQESWE